MTSRLPSQSSWGTIPPKPDSWPPNYVEVYAWRQRQLRRLRADPGLLYGAKCYYKDHPAEFISHWCDTFDPRNIALGMPSRLPFVLFRRQVELVNFFAACLMAQADGLVEKTRDMGATFGACGASIWLWLFHPGSAVGWGSYKQDLVDKIGVVDSVFEKLRQMIVSLPPEFLPPGLEPREHLTFMRCTNPDNGASIAGEVGDNMGRGGRKSIYFKDESAHYEHPELIEAALTDNTRCQIDLSSVHGLGNVFHRKREAGVDWEPGQKVVRGRTNVFIMDWRDHPLKTQVWHDERETQFRENGLSHVFAQEVDRNYAASVEGVIIRPEWVAAAIDAHKRIEGLTDDGGWVAALDVADEGLDTNAFARRKGIMLKSIVEWGERDTGATARRAITGCKGLGNVDLNYDCIGVGAGVKAEANRLRDEKLLPAGVRLVPWSAAAEVFEKDKRLIPGDRDSPLNGDFFYNFKAQAWWQLARRFERTWRAINENTFRADPAQLISIPGDLPLVRKLQKELSQATATTDNAKMKMVVDKSPDGTKSPNLADAMVMVYWPVRSRGMPMLTAEVVARWNQ